MRLLLKDVRDLGRALPRPIDPTQLLSSLSFDVFLVETVRQLMQRYCNEYIPLRFVIMGFSRAPFDVVWRSPRTTRARQGGVLVVYPLHLATL